MSFLKVPYAKLNIYLYSLLRRYKDYNYNVLIVQTGLLILTQLFH